MIPNMTIDLDSGQSYSCPLDQSQLWEALRDTELNPVRADLAID
jgi:hypothetical protein